MSDEKPTKKVSVEIPSVHELAKRRSLIQALFGLVFLLFFFNFLTIKCNNTSLVSLTGMNLVTGVDVSKQLDGPLKDISSMSQSMQDEVEDDEKKESKIPPNMYAIIALAAVIIGGVILFVATTPSNSIAAVCAGIAFVALIGLKLTFSANLQEQDNEFVKVSVQANFAYWLALVVLLINTYLSFIRHKHKYE
ncbi:hypothetical protein K5I29_05795 [Flavobacterium agricola]|uniref:Uncharacterized protein n=1 Tax=Flavobacterium agricola TaxID=2870839 RepID=A0ABY6M1G1_9FLAO|nr:hypothetical protein [Flavobacterium agricola]UYW02407.1 hypothetical protein K5I29_05795 [Flavobacterium agricola]